MTNLRADLLARQDEALALSFEAEIEANNHMMGALAVAHQMMLDSVQADVNLRNAELQAKADAVRAGVVTLPPATQLGPSEFIPKRDENGDDRDPMTAGLPLTPRDEEVSAGWQSQLPPLADIPGPPAWLKHNREAA